jgi:hypothetical protein
MSADTHCPTCGAKVAVVSADEGTSYYAPAAESRLAEVEAELAATREALEAIHEYHCGCDQPGRIDVCVAQPVVVFAVLSEESQGTKP